jgi:hypothetical protein
VHLGGGARSCSPHDAARHENEEIDQEVADHQQATAVPASTPAPSGTTRITVARAYSFTSSEASSGAAAAEARSECMMKAPRHQVG